MYSDTLNFTKTNQFGCGQVDEDDVYTIEEFLSHCKNKTFIDYDGYGYPVKNKKADRDIKIKPSTINNIPKDCTHIVWYNR